MPDFLAKQFSEVDFNSRPDALTKCFTVLDKDGSGYVELHEVRALVNRLSPQANFDEAVQLLRVLDTDADHKVSLAEFTAVLTELTASMEDAEFKNVFGAILIGDGPNLFKTGSYYNHPKEPRAYLESAVVPVLKQGLLELVAAMETHKLQLASGVLWEGGQYLPSGWQPFSPLRWLADWLLANRPQPVFPSASSAMDAFAQLSREAKCELAFKHLDRDMSGFLDVNELLVLAGRLCRDADLARAQQIMDDMDTNKNGTVELAEYVTMLMKMSCVSREPAAPCPLVQQLAFKPAPIQTQSAALLQTKDVPDDEFDDGIRTILAADHLSCCLTQEEKLKFLFKQTDKDRSGTLTLEEVRALALQMDPKADEATIAATLKFLDKDGSAIVTEDEFVGALSDLLTEVTLEGLDAIIIQTLSPPVDPAAELEPPEFADYVRQLPVHNAVPQMSPTDIMDMRSSYKSVLLVDVRTAEEQAVSMLPGALAVSVLQENSSSVSPLNRQQSMRKNSFAAMAVNGWSVSPDGLRRLAHAVDDAVNAHGYDVTVVAYNSTGAQCEGMIEVLARQLRRPVYNLCGGIIGYYNQGGQVNNSDGLQVQAIHPGDASLQQFITRPSNYKL